MKNPLARLRPTEVPVVENHVSPEKTATDKEANVISNTSNTSADGERDSDEVSLDAQAGVQNVEAMTKTWSRSHLILAYVTIWFIYFVDAMQQSTTSSLTPYVTSSFYAHSLTAATSVMSSLIGGIFKLPLAKIIDIWGRPQGFVLMLCCLVVGLVMMAACQNVQTYAAAQVFYWVGYNGVTYTISIFIADTSALKNRALMFAFASSPYIITVWIGGPLATAFLNGPGFRWGFGVFAIITPIVCSPLLFLFWYNYNKAAKAGLIPKRESNRTFMESVKYYAIEFDVVGLLLISAGLALFLLPFNIYSYQTERWRAPIVICMLIFGFLLLIAFGLYEKFLAPKTFIPYELLMDRTVLGACVLAGNLFISFYIWDSYFFSFLQVVNNLGITQSSYIMNTYSIGSCFWSFVVGAAIRWSGRFRWLALYFGVPVTILGVGLMVHFRQPDVNIGYIVMCQIFIAVGGGTLVICEQMAVMAATNHQYIAVVLAVEAMFASVGGGIGSTVAAAIWTGVFPTKLAEYLPQEAQGNLTSIYASLPVQLSYPVGTPTRDAISAAYGDAQKVMLIAATVIQVISLIAVWVWRDIKVKDFKQVKGMVI
ncbi:major facilitator superfamily domain-containing protein [Diplogelasinospora grovesii]|uniref:Major facilitator superfamily domain-containing protein n=1 Tax=Diplogelasinospora grovesii TaxID=303347 RepID=A0AAN6RYK7_9PEZI|nr:major facilitator superfamily domain-containing protein [Diplogelasinospora grovesii]